MADIIRFPRERRIPVVDDYRREPAMILVLPVIRIEREPIRVQVAGGSFSEFEDIMAAMVAQFMGDI
jgi:hypothetical protein